MAIHSRGNVVNSPTTKDGTTSSKTSGSGNGATGPCWVIVCTAADNSSTTDGDNNEVTSVTDADSHTYVKLLEFTNSRGAANGGANCSIWMAFASGGIPVSQANYFTVQWSSNRAAKGFTIWAFWTDDTSSVLTVEATNTLAVTAGAPGSLDATTPNEACLRVRALASETSLDAIANFVKTAGVSPQWTAFAVGNTTGGGSASNMAWCAEFSIFTGTGAASNPTYDTCDHASCYVALKEVIGGPPGSYYGGMGGWW